MIIGAVDPGISGGLAVLSDEGECETILMPILDDVVDGPAVMDFFRTAGAEFICIEKVHSMPRQGVVSTFNFGHSTGQVRTVGQIICGRPRLVRPQEWKKAFDLIGSDKNASRDRAIMLFPKAADQFKRVKDHGRAEAALIGAYHLGMHL